MVAPSSLFRPVMAVAQHASTSLLGLRLAPALPAAAALDNPATMPRFFSTSEDEQPPGAPENRAPLAFNPDKGAQHTAADWPLDDRPEGPQHRDHSARGGGPQAVEAEQEADGPYVPGTLASPCALSGGGHGTPLQPQRTQRYVNGDSSDMVHPRDLRAEGSGKVVDEEASNTLNAPEMQGDS